MRNSHLEKIRFEEILPVPSFISVVVHVQVMECSLACMLGVFIAKLSTVQFWPAKSFFSGRGLGDRWRNGCSGLS